MKTALAIVAFALALEGALILQLALPGDAAASGLPAQLVQAAAPRPVRS